MTAPAPPVPRGVRIGRVAGVPVLVVVSLLAFVGSVSIARYIGGMRLQSAPGDGRDGGLPETAEERGAGNREAQR